jgi:hypothetical protein
MDVDITRDIFATNENSVIIREGSSNGTKMTSSIVNYEEVRRRQVAITRHICESVTCCKLSKNCKLTTLPLQLHSYM